MATILDLAEYRTMLGLDTDDASRDASLAKILDEVNDAITRVVRQPILTATYTEYYDAPPTARIVLRQWPVRSITSVKYAPESNGDPSDFTSSTLLTQYTDWILETEQPDGTSRAGILRNVNGTWGTRPVSPVNRLGWKIDPDYRAVQVVYVAGYNTIPQSLKTVARQVTSQLFHMRILGILPASASLNSASYSLQQPATASGLLSNPHVTDLLTPFMDLHV